MDDGDCTHLTGNTSCKGKRAHAHDAMRLMTRASFFNKVNLFKVSLNDVLFRKNSGYKE